MASTKLEKGMPVIVRKSTVKDDDEVRTREIRTTITGAFRWSRVMTNQ